jgi:hypothetical protein
MINVVCFCGCSYSFADDTGACPKCGEPVTLTRVSTGEVQEMREGPGRLSRAAGDLSGHEQAA